MPDLSACYFCGTALDEPLSEYPVVPLTLQPAPDEQKTVVLCSVCRRKLGKVLDAVLESIEDRPIDATVQQDLEEVSDDASADGDSVNDGTEDEGPGGAESDDEVWVTAGDSEYEDETAEVEADADEMEVEDEEDDAVAADVEDAVDAGGVDDVADADEKDEVVEAEADEDPESAETDAKADDPLATEHSSGQEPPTEDPPTAADGNGEDEDGPHLSALEYTKVMRLLENRDLPVDREEFRVVATNAYQITNEEFDKVIDAAIDRGLIVEENGQFVDVE